MANYPVVNIGTLAGEDVNAYVKSVQYTSALNNGSFVALDGLVSGQDGVFAATPVTDVTAQEVLLVYSPEIIEINGYRIDVTDPTLFQNPANVPARAYHIKVGDTITITDDGITGTTVLKQYAIPANGATQLAVAADLTGNTLVAFQVINKTTIAVGQTRKNATKLLAVRAL